MNRHVHVKESENSAAFITRDPGHGVVVYLGQGISVHVAHMRRQPPLCTESNHLFGAELLTEDGASQPASSFPSTLQAYFQAYFHSGSLSSLGTAGNSFSLFCPTGGKKLRLHKVERLLEEPPFNRLTRFSAPLVLFVQEILLA